MLFIFECIKVKQMIKTYSANIERLRAHEQRYQEMSDTLKKNHPKIQVFDDQITLYEALKQIKIRMQNTRAWYGGEQLTFWRLADTKCEEL